jgi:HEAT repeat protein
MLVSALGQTSEPTTPEALVTLARSDADPGVRAEAVHWYAVRAPEAALPQLMSIIGGDRDDAVKRRAVSSLGVLPADAGVPALIQLARTGPSPVIRKEAVSTLGRSTDARARAFLEELVAR